MIELREGTHRRRLFRLRQQNGHGDDAFRAKTGINREEALKTSSKQTGADEQHQRERDLRDDEQIARARLLRAR